VALEATQRRGTPWSMATRYYRMNSVHAAEAVMRKLESEPGFSPSRPLGYAHRKVVRVENADGLDPEPFVREIDPGARLVPKPTDRIGVSAP
jgi:hypothetical protein